MFMIRITLCVIETLYRAIIGLGAMFLDRLAAIKRCGRLRSRLHGIPDIGRWKGNDGMSSRSAQEMTWRSIGVKLSLRLSLQAFVLAQSEM
jgi:hypothetical protein